MPSVPRKDIWLPTSEMKVTVTEKGEVTIWEEMVMKRQAIKQTLGFSEKEKRHE